jgi:DNA polymerase-3 subunit gamma/tau
MIYQALYRKYRPKTFDDVCGQEIVTTTLKNAIKNNKLSHAYLFIGPRGTGKTSIAKIFAKTINCESTNEGVSCEKCDICKLSNNNENVDVIEMDAASNNGVDEVREIKNHVTFMPTFSKYKIYIIDEVHMLSSGAFNALLKTLEEPPKHVIFILATTEPQKVPLTIISRCQCFEFKSIPNSLIEERIKYICSKEKIKISEEAIKQIGEDSNGGLRDAIGLLDQLNSYTNGNINIEDVLKINGRVSLDSFNELFNNMIDNNLEGLFNISDRYNSEGKDYVLICEDIIKFLKNSLIDYQINNDNELIGKIGKDNVTKIIFEITDYIGYMRNLKEKKIFFDLLLIKLSSIIETNVRITISEPEIVIEKKEVPEVKVEPKEEKKEEIKEETPVTDEKYNKYDELMKIRLNNILAGADKESIKKYLEFINNLESDLDNLEERQIYNLLLDCEIVAGSCEGIVITTDSRVLLEELYDNLFNIENLINNKLSSNIKACFDLNDDWVKISEGYRVKRRNKEKIDILDETEVLNSITETKNVKKNEFEDLLEIGEM